MDTRQAEIQYGTFMRRCIELALIAKKRGDSPVGSIVVKDEKIVGEGIEGGKTHKDITFHAEVEAIRQAVRNLQTTNLCDCILITTHEPCILCSYIIRHHKISTVVVGVPSGEIGGFTSKYPILKDTDITSWSTPPHVIMGVLEKECQRLKN